MTKDSKVDFVMSGEQLSKILKASAVMKFDTLTLVSTGEINQTIKAKLSDSSNCTADTFELDLGLCETQINVKLFVENIKVLPASYDITVLDNLVMFNNDALNLTYWLANAE